MDWEYHLAAALGDEEGPLVSEAHRARELCREYRFGEALEILWDLQVKVRKSAPSSQRAFLALHLGKVYENWMFEVALKFFRSALEAARDAGSGHTEMVANHAIGEIYRSWREFDRARPWFERALDLAEEHAGPVTRIAILEALAECEEATGHRRRAQVLRVRRRRNEEEARACVWGDPRAPGFTLPSAAIRRGSRR